MSSINNLSINVVKASMLFDLGSTNVVGILNASHMDKNNSQNREGGCRGGCRRKNEKCGGSRLYQKTPTVLCDVRSTVQCLAANSTT
jgi:hypothetical protein